MIIWHHKLNVHSLYSVSTSQLQKILFQIVLLPVILTIPLLCKTNSIFIGSSFNYPINSTQICGYSYCSLVFIYTKSNTLKLLSWWKVFTHWAGKNSNFWRLFPWSKQFFTWSEITKTLTLTCFVRFPHINTFPL